jgi:hypothetical protein
MMPPRETVKPDSGRSRVRTRIWDLGTRARRVPSVPLLFLSPTQQQVAAVFGRPSHVRAQFDCTCTRRRQVRIWCVPRTSSLATVRPASHGLPPEFPDRSASADRRLVSGHTKTLAAAGEAQAARRTYGRQPACARHAERNGCRCDAMPCPVGRSLHSFTA